MTKDSEQHEHTAHTGPSAQHAQSASPAYFAATSASAPTPAAAPSSDLAELREALMRYREERRWWVYHNPKDLALALSVEAGEFLEVFLLKSG